MRNEKPCGRSAQDDTISKGTLSGTDEQADEKVALRQLCRRLKPTQILK
jgi:hypothetical protein